MWKTDRHLDVSLSFVSRTFAKHYIYAYVCFFVCLMFFRPTREFLTHIEKSLLPVKGRIFWPILDTHGHWAVGFFFSVPHILWHGASDYHGHLRGPLILTSVAERLAVELSLPVLTTKVCRGCDSNLRDEGSNCATAAVVIISLFKRIRF